MMLVNLIVALMLDNFDLMGSEDMAVSDMDIILFKRKWHYSGSSYRSIHSGMPLHQVEAFVKQPGMGTFSMMFQAGKSHNRD